MSGQRGLVDAQKPSLVPTLTALGAMLSQLLPTADVDGGEKLRHCFNTIVSFMEAWAAQLPFRRTAAAELLLPIAPSTHDIADALLLIPNLLEDGEGDADLQASYLHLLTYLSASFFPSEDGFSGRLGQPPLLKYLLNLLEEDAELEGPSEDHVAWDEDAPSGLSPLQLQQRRLALEVFCRPTTASALTILTALMRSPRAAAFVSGFKRRGELPAAHKLLQLWWQAGVAQQKEEERAEKEKAQRKAEKKKGSTKSKSKSATAAGPDFDAKELFEQLSALISSLLTAAAAPSFDSFCPMQLHPYLLQAFMEQLPHMLRCLTHPGLRCWAAGCSKLLAAAANAALTCEVREVLTMGTEIAAEACSSGKAGEGWEKTAMPVVAENALPCLHSVSCFTDFPREVASEMLEKLEKELQELQGQAEKAAKGEADEEEEEEEEEEEDRCRRRGAGGSERKQQEDVLREGEDGAWVDREQKKKKKEKKTEKKWRDEDENDDDDDEEEDEEEDEMFGSGLSGLLHKDLWADLEEGDFEEEEEEEVGYPDIGSGLSGADGKALAEQLVRMARALVKAVKGQPGASAAAAGAAATAGGDSPDAAAAAAASEAVSVAARLEAALPALTALLQHDQQVEPLLQDMAFIGKTVTGFSPSPLSPGACDSDVQAAPQAVLAGKPLIVTADWPAHSFVHSFAEAGGWDVFKMLLVELPISAMGCRQGELQEAADRACKAAQKALREWSQPLRFLQRRQVVEKEGAAGSSVTAATTATAGAGGASAAAPTPTPPLTLTPVLATPASLYHTWAPSAMPALWKTLQMGAAVGAAGAPPGAAAAVSSLLTTLCLLKEAPAVPMAAQDKALLHPFQQLMQEVKKGAAAGGVAAGGAAAAGGAGKGGRKTEQQACFHFYSLICRLVVAGFTKEPQQLGHATVCSICVLLSNPFPVPAPDYAASLLADAEGEKLPEALQAVKELLLKMKEGEQVRAGRLADLQQCIEAAEKELQTVRQMAEGGAGGEPAAAASTASAAAATTTAAEGGRQPGSPPALTPLQRELAASLREVQDFPAPGVLFRDIQPLLSSASLRKAAFDAMAEDCSKALGLDLTLAQSSSSSASAVSTSAPASAPSSSSPLLIAGIDARGFIFATALAERLGAGLVMLRKKGKLPICNLATVSYGLEYGSAVLQVDRSSIPAGSRVLIADDLLATGGSAAAACQLVQQCGGKVIACSFLIELQGLEGREVVAAAMAAGAERAAEDKAAPVLALLTLPASKSSGGTAGLVDSALAGAVVAGAGEGK